MMEGFDALLQHSLSACPGQAPQRLGLGLLLGLVALQGLQLGAELVRRGEIGPRMSSGLPTPSL
jgi:hypothetical protein